MSDDVEHRLWRQAQAGDRAALDQILRQHEKSIYRFGLRLCGDADAAQEVLQRTMLTAFEQIGTFRGDAKISTWLYAIARSSCSRLHRRTRSAPTHDLALDADEGAPTLLADGISDPDRNAQAGEMAEVVAAAISLLPEQYREVVVLRDVEGLTAEEAAGITALEIPALKSRLHRGREALRANLVTLLRESGGQVGAARACPDLRDQLAAAGTGEVDQAACKAIEAHLGTCAACAEALGDLRDAASLCRRLPTGDVPRPVQRAVRTAIIEALGKPQEP